MSKASNEHSLRRSVSKWLMKEMKAKRLWFVKFTPNAFTRAGIPDYILCIGGRFLAIELKREGEHPTPIQQREGVAIYDAGGSVAVCYTLEQVIALVESWRSAVAVSRDRRENGVVLSLNDSVDVRANKKKEPEKGGGSHKKLKKSET